MAGDIISFLEIEIRLEQRVRQLCQYGHLFLGVVTRHRVRLNEFSVLASSLRTAGSECVSSSLDALAQHGVSYRWYAQCYACWLTSWINEWTNQPWPYMCRVFDKAGEIAIVLLARCSPSKPGSRSVAKYILAICHTHVIIPCEPKAGEGARSQSPFARGCEKNLGRPLAWGEKAKIIKPKTASLALYTRHPSTDIADCILRPEQRSPIDSSISFQAKESRRLFCKLISICCSIFRAQHQKRASFGS